MTDKTTLRFYVREVLDRHVSYGNASSPAGNVQTEVTLNPSTKPEANAAWAAATPVGQLTLTVKGLAAEFFRSRVGRDVHIEIGDVPE